jgi:hypothetical protein
MSSRHRINLRPPNESERDGGPGEAASYLVEAVAELAQMARRHRLDMLCFLLEMALLEAEEVVRLRRARPSPK